MKSAKQKQKEDLRPYRVGPLTVLQLMAVLAILGILVAWVVKHYS